MVDGQAYSVQRMPNGQLVVIQNPNVGMNNPNLVIAQQPHAIQTTVPIIQQPDVVQQLPKQNVTVSETL